MYAANVASCLAVKPGEHFQALVDEPFADVGARLCDAALAAGAASAACVVVPDSGRPLTTSYEPFVASLGKTDAVCFWFMHIHDGEFAGFRKPLYARARDGDARGVRRAHGPLDAGARDGGRLRRPARAHRGPRRAAHGLGARARDDAGRHRLHVRRDGARVEARRRRARPAGRVRQPAGGRGLRGAARDGRRRRLRDRPLDRAGRRGAGRRADPADVPAGAHRRHRGRTLGRVDARGDRRGGRRRRRRGRARHRHERARASRAA